MDYYTKIVLGSKIALLYTRENLDAYNGGILLEGTSAHQASDSDKHLSGMLSFTAGLVKKNDQGGNFFILGSVNIANDVSSIKNQDVQQVKTAILLLMWQQLLQLI